MSEIQTLHNRYVAMKQYVDENIKDCIYEYVRDSYNMGHLLELYTDLTGKEPDATIISRIFSMSKGEKIGVVIGKVVNGNYQIGWSRCSIQDDFDPVHALYVALHRMNGGAKIACVNPKNPQKGEPHRDVLKYIDHMKKKLTTRLEKQAEKVV